MTHDPDDLNLEALDDHLRVFREETGSAIESIETVREDLERMNEEIDAQQKRMEENSRKLKLEMAVLGGVTRDRIEKLNAKKEKVYPFQFT